MTPEDRLLAMFRRADRDAHDAHVAVIEFAVRYPDVPEADYRMRLDAPPSSPPSVPRREGTAMADHTCTVCFQSFEKHGESCEYCEAKHWPPLCCAGCDCGSFEQAHPDAECECCGEVGGLHYAECTLNALLEPTDREAFGGGGRHGW